ncbi:MAG: HAD family phosphatase [Candidatus Aenigmarchaeota archaeon]|nr:HAD family phosphatase [Candidatus Aenigmarchaeota archaeon]
MIKAIIFDYYGVMCPRIVPILSQKTSEQFGAAYEEVHRLMNKLLDRLDDDSITFQQYWEILKAKLKNRNTKLSQHYKIWRSSALQLNLTPEMRNLSIRLKKSGYKVSLLTNVTKTMVKYNRMKGRYKLFRPVFLSCYLGTKKPSAKIYRHALKKMRLKAKECIFIDDQEDYLKGAKSVGLNTILFKNASQLRRELARAGVHGI